MSRSELPELVLDVVQYETQPWVITVFNENGGKPTFSGDTVTFYMWGPHPITTLVIEGGAVTVDSSGDDTTFSYSPVADDVNVTGVFRARYLITHTNTKTEEWPKDEHQFVIDIKPSFREEPS